MLQLQGIILVSRTMELQERVIEACLTAEVSICEQQYGFVPRKSTIDNVFEQRSLRRTEKVRGELNYILVGLEKTDNRVQGKEYGTGLESFAGGVFKVDEESALNSFLLPC